MGEKRMENFALEQVRPEDRKGWISLAFVQMGMIICVPSLLLGCLLSLGMPLWKAIASGTAGYLLTVLLSFPLGMQGGRIWESPVSGSRHLPLEEKEPDF